MAEIALSKVYVTIVDDDLFDWLNQWKWCASEAATGGLVYAVRSARYGSKSTRFAMHRIIAGAPDGAFVDHRNRNGLDNRRENLRYASIQQNAVNSTRAPSASGFRGVCGPRSGHGSLYHARLTVNGRSVWAGSADTAEGAARLYDKAALEHWGEFAVLNFPEEARA